jgi:hypothetical protein
MTQNNFDIFVKSPTHPLTVIPAKVRQRALAETAEVF